MLKLLRLKVIAVDLNTLTITTVHTQIHDR